MHFISHRTFLTPLFLHNACSLSLCFAPHLSLADILLEHIIHAFFFFFSALANSSICLPWLRLVSARKCRALAALQSDLSPPEHLLRAHPSPLSYSLLPPLRTPLLLHSHSRAGSFQRLVCCIIYHVKCARHTAANQTSPRTRELRMLPSHPLCSMQPRPWQTDSCTGWLWMSGCPGGVLVLLLTVAVALASASTVARRLWPHKNKCKCNLKTTLQRRGGGGVLEGVVGGVGRLAGSGPMGLTVFGN